MQKTFAILLFVLPVLWVEAQSIRLTNYSAPTALYADADRLYNFNLYERSRWEMGLKWVVPNAGYNGAKYFLGQWTFGGYAAYGVGDHDVKFGGSVQLRLADRRRTRLLLRAYKDLEGAASRSLSAYRLLAPRYNTGYVSSRFVGMRGGEAMLLAEPWPRTDCRLGLRLTWEDYRFDDQRMLYPTLHPEEQQRVRPFAEAMARLGWDKAWTADVRAGRVADTQALRYVRALLQYDGQPGGVGLEVFGQMGFCTAQTPYSRMFDNSGTQGLPYFFRNAFLTVAPNTYTSNLFGHLCLHYEAPRPLWALSWTAPRPFVQLNTLWGRLWGEDAEGRREWEGLHLQSPRQGLVEPSAGVDGLVRWGLLDVGVGVAYRLSPQGATSPGSEAEGRWAWSVVIDFLLDNYFL